MRFGLAAAAALVLAAAPAAAQQIDGTWRARAMTEDGGEATLEVSFQGGRYSEHSVLFGPSRTGGGPGLTIDSRESGAVEFRPPDLLALTVEDWSPKTGPRGDTLARPADRLLRILSLEAGKLVLQDTACGEGCSITLDRGG
jgi:hypothetical protein